MPAPAPVNRAELFAGYEAAIAGLVKVPLALAGEMAEARKSYDAAIATAVASAKSEEERLARLRGSMTTRYGDAAKALQAANILIPPHVRPAPGRKGDARSLAAAITAQEEAETAVRLALHAAASTANQQSVGDKARAAAGREAAEALRRRQEQMLKTRQKSGAEAEAERKRLAEDARARRSRQWLVGGGVALLVLLLIVVVALLLA